MILPRIFLRLLLSIAVCIAAFSIHIPALSAETAEQVQTTIGEEAPVLCTADHMEYDDDGNLLAKGNVQLTYKTIVVKADEIKYNTQTKEAEAKGNLFLTETDQEVKGESAKYNVETKQGRVEQMSFLKEPWFFQGTSIEKPSEKEGQINHGIATTCKLHDHPHYHIAAGKIYIKMGEKIEAWWAVFYIRGVPVFVFPYLYRSLKDKRNPVTVTPGYSSSEGFFVKTAVNYRIADDFPGTAKIDYMSKRGWGLGLDQGFNGENTTGSVDTYYLRDKQSGRKRWSLYGDCREQFSDTVSGVVKAGYQSDETLEQESFVYSSPIRERRAHAALTKRLDNSVVTVAVERDDSWYESGDTKGYRKNIEELPQVNWQMTSTRLGETGLYYSHNVEFKNYYLPNKNPDWTTGGYNLEYYNQQAGFYPSLWRTFNLSRLTTFSANIGFSEVWRNVPEYTGGADGFLHSYNTGLNWHQRLTLWAETDAGHQFGQQINKRTGIRHDGITTNHLSGRLGLRPSGKFAADITTGYNFIGKGGLANIDPVNLDMRAHLHENVGNRTNVQYSVEKHRIQNLSTDLDIGKRDDWFFGFGVNYVPTNSSYKIAETLDFILRMGLKLGKSWRIETEQKFDVQERGIKEQDYYSRFDLSDCWSADFTMKRWRVGVSEYSSSFGLTFNLTAFPGAHVGSARQGLFNY